MTVIAVVAQPHRRARGASTARGPWASTSCSPTADVVTIHMPLSERSRGLVGAAELAAMKPTAYLVNTSRGPIVDEAALLDALRERRIAGAGAGRLRRRAAARRPPAALAPNTLLLPHIGYVTTDTYRHWFAQVVEDIVGWDAGTPQRVLT